MKQAITVNLQSPWKIKGNVAEAPVTMMVEGVHHGSRGAIFWPAHVLRENAHKWQNAPVVIDHPYKDGQAVSVQETPERVIGRVIAPQYDQRKRGITGRVQVSANNPNLSQLQRTKEVSVGVFSEDTESYGVKDGMAYRAAAITMEPDHLALLPEGQGACSWTDGCGIRNNSLLQEFAAQAAQFMINQVNEEYKATKQQEKIALLPPDVNAKEEGFYPLGADL